MDLTTISMDKSEAREKFLEYKRAVKARHDDEDFAIMQGYRALAMGKQLINLTDTIRAGGFDELWRPRLAIARADQTQIRLELAWDGRVGFHDGDSSRWRHPRCSIIGGKCWRSGTGFGAHEQTPTQAHFTAMVPIVPAGLRPSSSLSGYRILWEAEWQKVVPRDPALLKHIGGDLYAVVAIWNLTDLERAVLGARLR